MSLIFLRKHVLQCRLFIPVISLAGLLFSGCSGTMPSHAPLPVLQASTSSTVALVPTWSVTLPGGATLLPAINGETLYIGNRSGQVQAINLRNGTIQWSQSLNIPVQGSLSANAETLIVTTPQGEVISLDSLSGKQNWKQAIGRRILGAAQFLPDSLALWSEEGSVILLGKSDGKEHWVHEATNTALLLRAPRTGTVALGAIFTGTPKGKLTVLDIQSGRPYWEVSLTDSTQHLDIDPLVDASATPPFINSKHVCASTPHKTACVDPLKGSIVWTQPLGTITGLEGDGLNLYGTTPQGSVFALKASSGSLLWEYTALKDHTLLKPELLNNSVWIAFSDQPLLIQLNADNGTYQGNHTLPAATQWMRALNDHTLILQTTEGQILRYDLKESSTSRSTGSTRE